VLSAYEKKEVASYQNVYFLDVDKMNSDPSGDFNSGYDNENGDYLKLEIGDQLAYRFEIIDKLGRGSFGQVVKVIDHKNG
jgi:dual specificity tyrosine-phosphorylation-regulated kinase 2/3/4